LFAITSRVRHATGKLPYLQGQPIIGADGGLVVRDEVPESSIPLRILRAPPCPPGKHHLS
jgi:hypothetical protein